MSLALDVQKLSKGAQQQLVHQMPLSLKHFPVQDKSLATWRELYSRDINTEGAARVKKSQHRVDQS